MPRIITACQDLAIFAFFAAIRRAIGTWHFFAIGTCAIILIAKTSIAHKQQLNAHHYHSITLRTFGLLQPHSVHTLWPLRTAAQSHLAQPINN
jgi:hypothetical protein